MSVRFPKGFVTEPTSLQRNLWWLRDNWAVFLLLIPILTFVALFHIWWRHGRDPKGRGTIVAEYDPPDNLRPTELGTLLDGRVHSHDFSAAIVDLAVRGYLKIIEEEEKLFFGSSRSYRLQKIKDADVSLKPFEQELMSGLFGSGDEIKIKQQNTKLYQARKKIEGLVHEDMATMGYYTKNPVRAKSKYFGIAIVLAFVGFYFGTFIGGGFGVLTWVLTAGVFAAFAPFMPQRTHKGALALEHARGFKLFLETAERYRLQWQEKEGIFERYLPYAMVFGVTDKWAKALADVAQKQPDWYVGYFPIWNPLIFGQHLESLGSSVAAVSAPKSSGGGGGGGFSGGGFGGGGGGSW